MAYSPQTDYLYAVGCVSGASMRRGPAGLEFLAPVRPPGSKQYGLLAAIDAKTAKIDWQKRLPWAECQGSGAVLPTAGGLLFRLEADGVFSAYDARTGDVVWHFQTGEGGLGALTGASTGAAMTYEIGGDQFVAVANNHSVIAFKLGGTLPERPAPMPAPLIRPWAGRVQETTAIQLGTTRTFDIPSMNKKVDFVDDYGIAPSRTKITAGMTITFTNTSKLSHTIAARDGSWSTGPIKPGASASLTITKPGEYEYTCTEHPWAFAQLVVEAQDAGQTTAPASAMAGVYTKEQASRGQAAYNQSCRTCHMDDLSGSDHVPALAGDAFMMLWENKSVGDLYNRTRLTMPQGSAGQLSPQTYIDIVAFMLKANNFPAGASELAPNEDSLTRITIQKK
jgi:plastocyanin